MLKKSHPYIVLSVVLNLISVSSLEAGHFSFGEMFYEWIGDEAGKGQYDYRIYTTVYLKDGEAITPGTSNISGCFYKKSTPGNSTSFQLNYVSPAQQLPPKHTRDSTSVYGWWPTGPSPSNSNAWSPYSDWSCSRSNVRLVEYRYVGEVTLPGKAPDWRFGVDFQCCRDNNDNLKSSDRLYLQAKLNNNLGPNSSPAFNKPTNFKFCLRSASETPFKILLPTREENGDSLVTDFAIDGALKGTCGNNPTSISYQSNLSANNPFSSATPILVDSQRGSFTFRPDQVGEYVVKFETREYRYDSTQNQWIQVGNMVREIPFIMGSCIFNIEEPPELIMISFNPGSGKMDVIIKKKNRSLSGFKSVSVHDGNNTNTYNPDTIMQGVISQPLPSNGKAFYSVFGFKKCGIRTDSSKVHENISVSASISGNDVTVNWTPYKGQNIDSYEIYTTHKQYSNISLVDSVDSTTTSYTVSNVGDSVRNVLVAAVLKDTNLIPSGYSFKKKKRRSSDINFKGPLGGSKVAGIGLAENLYPQIEVYPNPTRGTVKIEVEQLYQEEVYDYKILNSTGQAVLKGSLKSGTTGLNISNLPNGLYFLNFEGRDGAEPILKQ